MAFILAIDQGTTATKSLIIDDQGRMIGVKSVEYAQHYPKPGFVEHDGCEIKASVRQSVSALLQENNIDKKAISAIGITNQRETLCLFDQQGETPLPFIVWQCRRSMDICERLKQQHLGPRLYQITGLHLDPYFSATKLLWLFEHFPYIKEQITNGRLLIGTIDSFLCHWFSGGALHISDVTNASRTMLMDLKTCQWSDECLKIFSIPPKALPTIVKNLGPFGFTKGLDFLPDGLPIAALAGDQHAALFGQNCLDEGMAKATFGTGCFIMQNTGSAPIFSKHGLLSTVAYQIGPSPVYALEGSAFIAGAALQFLIDTFGLAKNAHEIDQLADSVLDNGGVTFVPALCGLGAPYWQADARGALFGLSRGTKAAHIARAALEGIALQNTDIIDAMTRDARSLRELKCDGGASRSDLLMQIQADLLKVSCHRSQSPHQTALGIAYMAALAIGAFSDTGHIKKVSQPCDVFAPNPDNTWAGKALAQYHQSLKRLL